MERVEFDEFINLFEKVFNLKKGMWHGYDEGDFVIHMIYSMGAIVIDGEGKRFRTGESEIKRIKFTYNIHPSIEFYDEHGNCCWWVDGNRSDDNLTNEYVRLTALCKAYR